jgi:hypothetical protein
MSKTQHHHVQQNVQGLWGFEIHEKLSFIIEPAGSLLDYLVDTV